MIGGALQRPGGAFRGRCPVLTHPLTRRGTSTPSGGALVRYPFRPTHPFQRTLAGSRFTRVAAAFRGRVRCNTGSSFGGDGRRIGSCLYGLDPRPERVAGKDRIDRSERSGAPRALAGGQCPYAPSPCPCQQLARLDRRWCGEVGAPLGAQVERQRFRSGRTDAARVGCGGVVHECPLWLNDPLSPTRLGESTSENCLGADPLTMS